MASSDKNLALSTKSEMYPPGTTILTCKPFAHVGYFYPESSRFCDHCLKIYENNSNELRRCSACKMVRYCNEDCQTKSWIEGHRYECKTIYAVVSKLRNAFVQTESEIRDIMRTSRIILRLILKLQDRTDYFDELKIGDTEVQRRFGDLMSHSDKFREKATFLGSVQMTLGIVKDLFGPKFEIKLSDEELIEIYEKVSINSFQIGNGKNGVGEGVYLAGSVFDHSCSPMAVPIFDGSTMYVRNIVEIPKSLPIDEVTICYTNLLLPSDLRRKDLSEKYYFNCECQKCKERKFDKEMRSIKCSSQSCEAKIDTENLDDLCKSCGNIMTKKSIADIKELENNAIELLYENDIDLQQLEECIKNMKSMNFSDFHWVILSLCFKAYQRTAIGDVGGNSMDARKAYDYGTTYLIGVKRFGPPMYEQLLWHLLEMSWLALSTGKLNEAEEHLIEAISIAKVLHGEGSEFFKSHILPRKTQLESLKQQMM